jgi:preprotein translocase subunit SecG
MQTVVLFIHLAVCMCLIGLVLLQRSEGGALGMGGGGGGALMSGRGAADALARMTSIAGGIFLVTSLGLTFISGATAGGDGRSVLDLIPSLQQTAPAPAPAVLPEPSRPDPTESTAPEAAETQLASMTVGPPQVQAAPSVALPVAPAPVAASTRAAPLAARPAAATPQPAPARAQPVSAQRQPQSTAPVTQRPAQRSTATTIPASGRATPPANRPLVLPNTSGAATTPSGTAPAPSVPESVEVGNGVEAVRRERAGPDQ